LLGRCRWPAKPAAKTTPGKTFLVEEAMMKMRTRMSVPTTPGGYMDNPPDECPKKVSYCPNPEIYLSVFIAEYVRCEKCQESRRCFTKARHDSNRRRRVSLQKNGGE
jgi:hypothetical protein